MLTEITQLNEIDAYLTSYFNAHYSVEEIIKISSISLA